MKRQNDNNKNSMTREAFRRKHRPFYKKKSFIIPLILIIIIAIGIFIFWKSSSSKDTTKTVQPSHKIEKVKPKKKTTKKTPAKKKQEPQKVTKEEPKKEQKNDNQPQTETKPKTNTITNPGSYNNLAYDTDWYTFKISNEVKLVKDANGDAALMDKYNYTNKTQSSEIPQKVQANAIMLKQDGKQLEPTSPASGDTATLVNTSNNGLVQTGKSFDGALLVKVNSTDSEVTMYFKNIQTDGWLDTTQPLKLD